MPGQRNPEVTAFAAIVSALEELDGAQAERVLTHAAQMRGLQLAPAVGNGAQPRQPRPMPPQREHAS